MKKALCIAFVLSLLGICPRILLSQDQKTFDQYIDDGFAPISHFLSDVVFFSPVIRDDIIYREIGQRRNLLCVSPES